MDKASFGISVLIGATVGKQYFSAFDNAEQRATKLGSALEKTNRKLASAREAGKYKSTLDSLRVKQQAVGGSSSRLADGITDVGRRYKEAKRQAKAYGVQVGSLAREQGKLSRESKRLASQLGYMNKAGMHKERLFGLRNKLLGGVGLAYGASRIFGSAMNLEQSEVRLSTVINSDNKEQDMAKARAFALEYDRNNMADASDILNIQYALNSAGLDATTARVGSAIVDKVATITNGAKEGVGEVIATVYNNLGDKIEGDTEQKLTRIGELLTKTQFKFQIRDFSQLGEGLKYASPAFQQFNVGLEQGVTLIGALNTAGLQGAQAGTAFAATMRNMSKASQELGFELARTASGEFDVIATIANLDKAVGGLGNMSQETADKLQKTFGEEGVRGAILLGKQLDSLTESQRDVTESSKGIIDANYAKFLDSSAAKWDVFGDNIRIVGQTLAGVLLPALNVVVGGLANGAKWISKGIEKHPVFGWVVGGLATSFITVAAALATLSALQWTYNAAISGSLAMGLKNIVVGGVIKTLLLGKAAALGVVTAAQWLFNAAVAANPMVLIVGAIIAAVAGLAYAAYLIYQNWDEVTAWLADKFSWVTDSLSTIGDLWNSIFSGEDAKITASAKLDQRVVQASNSIAGQTSTSSTANNQTNHFTINAQAGQDEEAIANAVMKRRRQTQDESETIAAYGY